MTFSEPGSTIQNGTWSFSNNESTLKIFGAYDPEGKMYVDSLGLISLDSKTLVAKNTTSYDGTHSSTGTVTFTAQ